MQIFSKLTDKQAEKYLSFLGELRYEGMEIHEAISELKQHISRKKESKRFKNKDFNYLVNNTLC